MLTAILSIGVGILIAVGIFLIVPWLVYIIEDWNFLNPIQWVADYFDWCLQKQKQLQEKRRNNGSNRGNQNS